MADVVGQGRDDERPGRVPTGARLVAVLLAVLAIAFVASRSGLLSADGPERPDRSAGPAEPDVEEASRLVAQVGDRLVRLGQDDWSEGALLPGRGPMRLVPVRSAAGAGTAAGTGSAAAVVVGVDDGLLFRVATDRDATWAPIGRARAVVGASAEPGRAVIWRADRVVEVDVGTGRVVDRAPFPGFDGSVGWSPEGVVAVTDTRALLMSRRPPGMASELALAWPARRVAAGANPAVQAIGTYGGLLGTADDWVLTWEGSCPGEGCRVQVVTLTRDAFLVRDVRAPAGWAFVGGPLPGRTHEAFVPVRRVDDRSQTALARLVAGGDNALLVRGTEGVYLAAGLVDTRGGAVYLVVRGDGPDRVRVWRPGRSGVAEDAPGNPDLPRLARLVCVCG